MIFVLTLVMGDEFAFANGVYPAGRGLAQRQEISSVL